MVTFFGSKTRATKGRYSLTLTQLKNTESYKMWDEEIKQVEQALEGIKLPNKLTIGAEHYNDLPKLISTHLSIVKHNNGKKYFRAYLNRLQLIIKTIHNGKTDSSRVSN